VVIEHGFPAVVIAPSGDMSTEMGRFMRTLKQRQAEILVISDAAEILDQAHIELQLPLHRHLLRRLSFEVRLHFTKLMYFEPPTAGEPAIHI
jgi:fructoselysine-6-P-deglycase FrlB-like protein